jgi:hypothetical protein
MKGSQQSKVRENVQNPFSTVLVYEVSSDESSYTVEMKWKVSSSCSATTSRVRTPPKDLQCTTGGRCRNPFLLGSGENLLQTSTTTEDQRALDGEEEASEAPGAGRGHGTPLTPPISVPMLTSAPLMTPVSSGRRPKRCKKSIGSSREGWGMLSI